MKLRINNIFVPFLFLLLALIGCTHLRKEFCAKKYMNNSQFRYVSNEIAKGSYFIIKDSMQIEYYANQLYSESAIKWTSCNSYFLVMKRINYTKGLQVGDTLFVKISLLKGDTLQCLATAYNNSFTFKLLKQ